MKRLTIAVAVLLTAVAEAKPVFITGQAAVDTLPGYQAKADAMKAAVQGAKSDYAAAKGTLYYVSALGDDARDGRSEATAVRSLSAVAKLPLKAGDAVLFRRGDLFRGRIDTVAGVTYSAYGEGAKPTLCASVRNYADPALWEATKVPNVYLCKEPIDNAGIITYDHDPQTIGKYDVKVGRMRNTRKGVAPTAQLKEEGDFWCDLPGKKLYLCCLKGNPGASFKRIEIGPGVHGICIRESDGVTVDNLHITLAGRHGISAGTVRNLEVRNCIFDWIGGSLLIPEGQKGGPCLFGNAVEVYGGCDGYRVHDCWMYQIYDTGITHQCHHANSKIYQSNVEYARNLIEYCFWSIEYYNAQNKYGETRNVYVHHNFCRYGGYGWGCRGRAGGTPMFSIDDRPDVTSNYVNEANILERSLGILVNNFGRHAAPPDFVFRKNVYVQPRGWNFASIGDLNRNGKWFAFDESSADVIREAFGEDDGTFVILPEEPHKLPK